MTREVSDTKKMRINNRMPLPDSLPSPPLWIERSHVLGVGLDDGVTVIVAVWAMIHDGEAMTIVQERDPVWPINEKGLSQEG